MAPPARLWRLRCPAAQGEPHPPRPTYGSGAGPIIPEQGDLPAPPHYQLRKWCGSRLSQAHWQAGRPGAYRPEHPQDMTYDGANGDVACTLTAPEAVGGKWGNLPAPGGDMRLGPRRVRITASASRMPRVARL